ncbi:DUF3253 domain-containing protein [Roseomonas aeriglobus]|nr:DUF3253 domain-containing protein [Roseomonas aeriglobus]
MTPTEAVLTLLAARADDATICPSEAARVLATAKGRRRIGGPRCPRSTPPSMRWSRAAASRCAGRGPRRGCAAGRIGSGIRTDAHPGRSRS